MRSLKKSVKPSQPQVGVEVEVAIFLAVIFVGSDLLPPILLDSGARQSCSSLSFKCFVFTMIHYLLTQVPVKRLSPC